MYGHETRLTPSPINRYWIKRCTNKGPAVGIVGIIRRNFVKEDYPGHGTKMAVSKYRSDRMVKGGSVRAKEPLWCTAG
jgi:hypothetical protein